MTTTRMLMFAGLIALASCGNDRSQGREVAVTDSLTRELEVAPVDTAQPLADERLSQAGGRAPAPAAAPVTKRSRARSKGPEVTRKQTAGASARASAARTASDSAATRVSAAAEQVSDTAGAAARTGVPPSPARDTLVNADSARADAVRTDSGTVRGVPEIPPPSTSPATAPAPAPRPAPTPAADTTAAPTGAPAPGTTAAPSAAASQPTPTATGPVMPTDMHALPAGMHVRALLEDSIHSLRNSAGQRVTALVSGDLRAPDGRTLVPSGSVIRLAIVRLKPARTRSAADGELELRPDSVVVAGRAYPVHAEVQPVPHELKGRGVTAGEAEKVAAGAAVGAVAGGVITGKTKGAVIGGAVGAAGGAVVAAQTASRDVVVTPRTLIVMTLTAPFAAAAPAAAAQ